MHQIFRTPLTVSRSEHPIRYGEQVLLMGSCFTEHIGERLGDGKWEALVNPYGIVYNPISLGDGLLRLLKDAPYEAQELFYDGELWHSWAHHGDFSGLDKAEVLRKINEEYRKAQVFLADCRHVILTLGTAYRYILKESGQTVANCHKVPAAKFEKSMLSVDEIVKALRTSIGLLRTKLPECRIILTVSPVRHLRDGMVENQRSKSTLLLACAQLESEAELSVEYFPSYEIFMDDLRDYRFAAADMVHPNEQAVEYIWQIFSARYFDEDTAMKYEKVLKLQQAMRHRVLHPGSESHIKFAKNQLEYIEQLRKVLPHLDWAKEIAHFSKVSG